MKTRHIERLPARQYYGRHAVGQVVLINGQVVFHGKATEAAKFESRVRK